MLAIFASDAIALPLSPSFPTGELQYILDNSEAKMLLATEKYANKAEQVLKAGLQREPLFDIRQKLKKGADNASVQLEDLKHPASGGMMLYTSGTTNRPAGAFSPIYKNRPNIKQKGVLIPDSAISAQATSLLKAWNYTPQDRLLHLLPLHHIHGVVNAILTPIFAGSSIEFMYPFNPDQVWRRLAAPFEPNSPKSPITFLTAVPTVYNRLMTSFTTLPSDIQSAAKQGISPSNLRLNISGSAALPTPTKTRWTSLSNGNVLLERFGMTEVGMAISCGLDPKDRVDGSVGWPLPGVQARLVDTETDEIIPLNSDREGEIQLRGETIFHSYWGNEKATTESFVSADDGGKPWFKTGDVARRQLIEGAGSGSSGERAKGPMYFIQGRKSVDIIKTGGEKISALEVEREMLSLYVSPYHDSESGHFC